MTDTNGEHGLVPTRLLLGVIPISPIISTLLPNQKEKMEALAAPQAETNSVIAERKIMTALTRDIPSAADRHYDMGDVVLV